MITRFVLFGSILLSAILPAADLSDLTWTVTNNEVTITNCDTNGSGALDIPDTTGGDPVVAIGDSAFHFCQSLTSITLPDSVTSIGNASFFVCTSLTSCLGNLSQLLPAKLGGGISEVRRIEVW